METLISNPELIIENLPIYNLGRFLLYNLTIQNVSKMMRKGGD